MIQSDEATHAEGAEPADEPEPARTRGRPRRENANEVPEEPKEQFDLNAYPETAKQKPSEKWHSFKDGVRGLLVWDFFDSRLTIRAHARIQVDGTVARANDTMEGIYGELGNGFDFRRLEAFAQGTIDHHLRYSLSFNFGADAGFGDIFVEGREHGLNVFGYRVGQFRLGSFQEPFSFEKMMSSYYTGFLERSLPVWTFTPGNNIGYMVFDTLKNKRFTGPRVSSPGARPTRPTHRTPSCRSLRGSPGCPSTGMVAGNSSMSVDRSVPGTLEETPIPFSARSAIRRFSRRYGKFPGSRIKLYGLELRGSSRPVVFPGRVHSVRPQRHRIRECELLGKLCPGELVPHR